MNKILRIQIEEVDWLMKKVPSGRITAFIELSDKELQDSEQVRELLVEKMMELGKLPWEPLTKEEEEEQQEVRKIIEKHKKTLI